MLFNSLSFLIYFPLVVGGYFVLPRSMRWAWLLLASCLFYMAFVPPYLLILLFTVAVDYVAGLLIERSAGGWRKAWLCISIVANVGILAVFKYLNFLAVNVQALAAWLHWNYSPATLDIVLPIGLSFHTFQAMSYTIEVYYGRFRAERHPGVYALYVLFFPQLVAGPIERPQHLLPQLHAAPSFDPQKLSAGLGLMLWGFFKKLVVADRMAPIVDSVYAHAGDSRPGLLLLATYCFAVQIYCDFSGYTDIARGAAGVMGFDLMENFDRPYAAGSVGEFWRRWHISLSTWFRDYLYIPLGGNRVGPWRWGVNVLLVFLLSGLWHGASWTFAIWGLLHGLYLVGSRLTAGWRKRMSDVTGLSRSPLLSRAVGVFVTFNLVAFAWVFFRAGTLAEAWTIAGKLTVGWFHPSAGTTELSLPFNRTDVMLAIAAVLVLETTQWLHRGRPFPALLAERPTWLRWPVYYAIALSILCIGDLGSRGFIYFQF